MDSDMLENLKTVRFMMGFLCGKLTPADMRKSFLAKGEQYEDLPDRVKGKVDDSVAEMVTVQNETAAMFAEMVRLKAKMTRMFYEALVAEKFSNEEALAITAAQPLEVK